MPLTFEQIIDETKDWPFEKVEELIVRLQESLHFPDPASEAAWNAEINRRIEEIQSGQVQGILSKMSSPAFARLLEVEASQWSKPG